MKEHEQSATINLGNGEGYSVLEIIEAARKVTNHPIPVRMEPRRAGDPARLVANPEKAKNLLGWEPKYTDIEKIIETAWNFYTNAS